VVWKFLLSNSLVVALDFQFRQHLWARSSSREGTVGNTLTLDTTSNITGKANW
jgi:hypothetical protein